MGTTKLRNPGLAIITMAGLSILVAPIAKAACGAHNSDGLSPALRSLQQPGVQGTESYSYAAASPDAQDDQKNDGRATILGMWKMVLYAGGELNDLGFEQFSAGGTELVNDVLAFMEATTFV